MTFHCAILSVGAFDNINFLVGQTCDVTEVIENDGNSVTITFRECARLDTIRKRYRNIENPCDLVMRQNRFGDEAKRPSTVCYCLPISQIYNR